MEKFDYFNIQLLYVDKLLREAILNFGAVK